MQAAADGAAWTFRQLAPDAMQRWVRTTGSYLNVELPRHLEEHFGIPRQYGEAAVPGAGVLATMAVGGGFWRPEGWLRGGRST